MVLTYWEVRTVPLKFTIEVVTKLVPVRVTRRFADPAVADVGDNVISAGAGLLTVKLWEPEVPPPGAGLVTVTVKIPAFATDDAGIVTLSCVVLTN